MTLKHNDKQFTDKAWERLHARLEQDGLLPGGNTSRPFIPRRTAAWASAIAVAAILCIVVVFSFNNNSNSNGLLLTLHNNEGAATLVKTLDDGSVVYLSGNTRLQYPEHFSGSKREVVLQGNAFFDISKKPEQPFFIETEAMRIEVLGTAFTVEHKSNDYSSLMVERGEVRVTSKASKQQVNVKAGQTAVLTPNSLKTVTTADSNLLEHYTRQIRFKDEPLGNIVNVINKNSGDVKITLSGTLKNRRLTMSFSDEPPVIMAELICMALNLHYVQRENTIHITEPNP